MKDYSTLPMLLDEATIARLTHEILDAAERCDPVAVVGALIEMLDRQSSHYRGFAPEVVARLDDWLVKVWRDDCEALVDPASSLIAFTGAPKALARLRQTQTIGATAKIRGLAEETLAEIARYCSVSPVAPRGPSK